MRVVINRQSYSYDVHSLVKAFFPEEDVKIELGESISNKDNSSEVGDVIYVYVSTEDEEKEEGQQKRTSNNASDGEIICSYKDKTTNKVYISKARPEIKNELKLCLYELLSGALNAKLPWGTLTGIRPTKIPMKMILEGKNDEEIRHYLEDTYYCSEGKIELSTEIAHREAKLLESIDSEGYSLYVGIPFCPTTCLYCSFTSYPIGAWKKRVREYLDAVKMELAYTSEAFKGKRLDSIYVGGGTPTTLEPDELRELINYIKDNFDTSYVQEITVEAGRPDSITLDKLMALKECGVTRISINPQTMNDKTLKIIGRRHSVDDVINAFNMAREAGFDNINMDIILGLPGEQIEDVRVTLEKISKLSPDSLTVHSMAIKRAAGMHKFLEEHEDIVTVNTPEMMEEAIRAAEEIGLEAYYLYRQKNMTGNLENIGFARSGKFGIYNILIMEEVQTIVACGAGTVTKRVYGDGRIERCDNVKDVALYISKIEEMIDRKRKLFAD